MSLPSFETSIETKGYPMLPSITFAVRHLNGWFVKVLAYDYLLPRYVGGK